MQENWPATAGPGPQPQWSDDGLWWWDGQQWLPVQAPPPQPPPYHYGGPAAYQSWQRYARDPAEDRGRRAQQPRPLPWMAILAGLGLIALALWPALQSRLG